MAIYDKSDPYAPLIARCMYVCGLLLLHGLCLTYDPDLRWRRIIKPTLRGGQPGRWSAAEDVRLTITTVQHCATSRRISLTAVYRSASYSRHARWPSVVSG